MDAADLGLDRTAERAAHQCINPRFLSGGGLYAWERQKDGRE